MTSSSKPSKPQTWTRPCRPNLVWSVTTSRAGAARQHHARELRLLEIIVHDAALGVDGAGRDDRMGDAEAADELDRRDAEGSAAVAAQLAAGHVDLVAVDGGQRAGDVGRVGDHGQPAVAEQFARQEAGRRAGVEHDRFAVADGRGDSLAMARLASAFSRMRRSNGASPTKDGRPIAPCILSTEPSLVSGFTSRRTVSSETLELVGQVGDGDRALLAEQAQDLAVALGMFRCGIGIRLTPAGLPDRFLQAILADRMPIERKASGQSNTAETHKIALTIPLRLRRDCRPCSTAVAATSSSTGPRLPVRASAPDAKRGDADRPKTASARCRSGAARSRSSR